MPNTHRAKKRRREAWRWQQGLCFYCARYVPKKVATLDHLVPASDGGGLNRGNVVMACQWCNVKRGTQDAMEFRLWVEKLGQNNQKLGPVDYNDARRRKRKRRKARGNET